MIRRLIAITTLGALTAFASGCGSTDPSRFYTLSSTASPTLTSSNVSIAVGPVSVPGAVDRPQTSGHVSGAQACASAARMSTRTFSQGE
jgi:hypothetical protein